MKKTKGLQYGFHLFHPQLLQDGLSFCKNDPFFFLRGEDSYSDFYFLSEKAASLK